MLKSEFDKRIGRVSTADEYDLANAVYVEINMDKDDFCEAYKKWGSTRLFKEIAEFIEEIGESTQYLSKTVDRHLEQKKRAEKLLMSFRDKYFDSSLILFKHGTNVIISRKGEWGYYSSICQVDPTLRGVYTVKMDDLNFVSTIEAEDPSITPPEEVAIALRLLGYKFEDK